MSNVKFTQRATLNPQRSMSIDVDGKHNVIITRTDEGVVVDVYQLPFNVHSEYADDADATCYSFDMEAP